jgi:hypothetical protein
VCINGVAGSRLAKTPPNKSSRTVIERENVRVTKQICNWNLLPRPISPNLGNDASGCDHRRFGLNQEVSQFNGRALPPFDGNEEPGVENNARTIRHAAPRRAEGLVKRLKIAAALALSCRLGCTSA